MLGGFRKAKTLDSKTYQHAFSQAPADGFKNLEVKGWHHVLDFRETGTPRILRNQEPKMCPWYGGGRVPSKMSGAPRSYLKLTNSAP